MKPIGVVLAGGKSSRFAPFVTNKTMWPLMGKPFLAHTLTALEKANFDELIVVGSTHNEAFLKTYQTGSLNLTYRLQNEALGMDDALKSISDLVSNRPILVLNAIDLFDINLLKDALLTIEKTKPKLLVCGYKTREYVPNVGYYMFNEGAVSGVVEKPDDGKQPSDVIRLVFDYFEDSSEFIRLFEKSRNDDIKDARYEFAQHMLLQKYGAEIIYTKTWSKLKYPHNALDVIEFLQKQGLASQIDSTSHISPHAIIEGAVYVDAGARIEAGAIIKGPSYIGRRVIVGNNALVRQSFIEEDTTVGFGSEVARSYIGPDCQIHHSFVGDSVLEKAVNMSWGTVTANLRLDKRSIRYKLPNGTYVSTEKAKLGALIAQDTFLGVNVSTMPGVCIPANARILPNTVVT